MPTAKQKKLRAQRETAKRRRLHGPGVVTLGTEKVLVFGTPMRMKEGSTVPSLDLNSMQPVAMALPDGRYVPTNSPSIETPTRAQCPVCSYSHKVRKDGTMGSHLSAQTIDAKQCAGSGQPWNRSAPTA